MFNKSIQIYKHMTLMRHFHLTIKDGGNESDYARLSQRKRENL